MFFKFLVHNYAYSEQKYYDFYDDFSFRIYKGVKYNCEIKNNYTPFYLL